MQFCKKQFDRVKFALYNVLHEMRNYPAQENERIAMTEKTVKNQKVKAPSKKELITQIRDASGKSFKELDSLSRANRETIAWVLELVS